jgi:flagellin FlaB
MKNQHRGVFPMYNTGIAAFFIIAVVFVFIFVNIGFSINDTDKAVVNDAYDEVREQLEVSGRISAAADVTSNKIMITSIPVRVANGGLVNLNPQTTQIAYNLMQQSNIIVDYENIYVDRLADRTFNSIRDAIQEAKNQGIIENDPFVDKQNPLRTTAFVYWVLNQNFDHFVDDGELAVITVVYSEKDRPSTGDKLFIEVNVPEGFVLRIDEEVPSISNEALNFGGILNES